MANKPAYEETADIITNAKGLVDKYFDKREEEYAQAVYDQIIEPLYDLYNHERGWKRGQH